MGGGEKVGIRMERDKNKRRTRAGVANGKAWRCSCRHVTRAKRLCYDDAARQLADRRASGKETSVIAPPIAPTVPVDATVRQYLWNIDDNH